MTTISEKLARLEVSMNAMRSTMGMSETSSVEEVEAQVLNNKNGLEEQATEIENLNNIVIEKEATIAAKEEEISTLNARIEELENPTPAVNLVEANVDNLVGHKTLYIKDLTGIKHAHIGVFSGYYMHFFGDEYYMPYRICGDTFGEGVFAIENAENNPLIINGIETTESYIKLFSLKSNPITLIDNEFTRAMTDGYIKIEAPECATGSEFDTNYINALGGDVFYINDNEPIFPDKQFVKGAAITDGETLEAGTKILLPKVEEYMHYWGEMNDVTEGTDLISIDDNNKLLSVLHIENMGMTMVEVGPKSDGETLEIFIDNGTIKLDDTQYQTYLFDSGMLNNFDRDAGETHLIVTKTCTVTFGDIYKNYVDRCPLAYRLIENEDYQG